MSRTSFTQTVSDFITASPWLGAEHGPAVTSLQALAEELDKSIQAALVAQFGLTYRNLQKLAPVTVEDDDPLTGALGAIPS